MEKIFKFKAKMLVSRFISDTFKIYVVDINKHIYRDIKPNKSNQFILVGTMPELSPDVDYDIEAKQVINPKFGVQYEVKRISRDIPRDADSTKLFLKEIINENQAEILISVYPDIVNKIIKNDLLDIDLSKTKGIKAKTFEKIRKKVLNNFALIEVIDIFGGMLSFTVASKLIEAYKNPEVIETMMKKNPYKALCMLSRIGFKTADAILLSLENETINNPNKLKFRFNNKLKDSSDRMMACLDYMLSETELQGNTKADFTTLREECGKLVPECLHHFVNVMKDETLFYIDYEDKTIAKRSTFNSEKYVAESVNKLISSTIRWDICPEEYRNIDNISLTDEQLNTIKLMCDNNMLLLSSPGGTGKSSSVVSLLNALDDKKIKYELMTPTGASAKVLSEYTKRPCFTIHRRLQLQSKEIVTLNTDLVVIDEFSMVDLKLFEQVCQRLDLSKTKLLLVFDPYQLPSVSCGNLAQDFIESKLIPLNSLTKVFRYDEGGIMQVATNIRNSAKFLDNNTTGTKVMGSKRDFIYIEKNQEQLLPLLMNVYKKLLDEGFDINDIMVLSSQNKGEFGTVAINKKLQQLFIGQTEQTDFIEIGENRFYLNDKVIQIRNNYKVPLYFEDDIDRDDDDPNSITEIMNGNIGKIVKIFKEKKLAVIEFGNELCLYGGDNFNDILLGYCITYHKSQGSAASQVVMIAPKSHTFMLNSNLLYVGATRSKKRLIMLGNINTINSSIKKKANLTRKTNQIKLLNTEKQK